MVILQVPSIGFAGILATETLLERLDPQRRAAVILALMALCLLGVTMVVLTMLGARWVRRQPLRPISKFTQAEPVVRPTRKLDLPPSESTNDTLAGPSPGEGTAVDT